MVFCCVFGMSVRPGEVWEAVGEAGEEAAAAAAVAAKAVDGSGAAPPSMNAGCCGMVLLLSDGESVMANTMQGCVAREKASGVCAVGAEEGVRWRCCGSRRRCRSLDSRVRAVLSPAWVGK